MSIRHSTLRQLQVYEAVARHLSFSRAASELHLTQPGVSMQVRELESNAGLPLFERIGKKLFVTEAGRELQRLAQAVLGEMRAAQEQLDSLQGLRSGRLDIAVISTAKYFAPQLLARFSKLYPAVEIRLAVNNREDVIAQLANNTVDLAIMGTPPQSVETLAVAFAPHPLVIIAAPDHSQATRRNIKVVRMAEEVFLVREPGSGTRLAMQQFFDERGVKIRIGMEMASNETIKQAVMAGMGVSFISSHTISLELSSKRLALLHVQGLPLVKHWHVAHLAAKRLSPTAAAFKAFVLEHGRSILDAHDKAA
jgi:DNA-binding transcriptional LysR family regulator